MDDAPRAALRKLIDRRGHDLAANPRLCGALLRDVAGDHPMEVSLLVTAAEEGVGPYLLQDRRGIPPSAILAQLTIRLERRRGLSPDAARWAVESWAQALGVDEDTGGVTIPVAGEGGRARDQDSTEPAEHSHDAIRNFGGEEGGARRVSPAVSIRGWLLSLGALALVGLGVVVVSLLLRQTEDLPNEGTPAATLTPSDDAFPNESEAELLARVPEGIRNLCVRAADGPLQGVTAKVACDTGGVVVQYNKFGPETTMENYFAARVGAFGVLGGNCATDRFAESTYTDPAGDVAGRVLCYRSDGSSWIEWTNSQLSIYAYAFRSDLNDDLLYEWWSDEAGPR